MRLAAQIGVSITEFWDITPFELGVYAAAYAERLEGDYERDILQAYLISRWVWQKRVNLKRYLGAPKAKRAMTDEEMLKRVKALNASMGGGVIRE